MTTNIFILFVLLHSFGSVSLLSLSVVDHICSGVGCANLTW